MSIEITVYASDVKGLDEHIERALDVNDYYGTALFDKHARLIDINDYEYFIEPTCYLGIMMDMQQQINELKKEVEKL
jgi:hypothetical protein